VRQAPSIAGSEASELCVESPSVCAGRTARAKPINGLRAISAAIAYPARNTTDPVSTTITT